MGILLDRLVEYGKSDFYPYHMPGHKRQKVGNFPEQITDMDITEIAGFDNLHDAQGILQEAQKRAAAAYGAEESFYLVNGSTCGILSAISAALPFGGHLLIARNCHKSVFHGAYMRHLKLSYVYPKINTEWDICEAITARQIEVQLQKDPTIQAVLIVSPTYEGRIADIRAIAQVVHGRNIPLIVDEAHGAHLGFAEGFALNSARLGADLVINSVHKTLPAMTQTGLLHCNGQRIDREILKRFLHIYQTSSPSYVMMASIEHGIDRAVKGTQKFQQFQNRWSQLLEDLQDLQKLRIFPRAAKQSKVTEHGFYAGMHDIGKLIISTKDTEISGSGLAEILRKNYHLEIEMACESYVLAMFTVSDTEEGYVRLRNALYEIDGRLIGKGSLPQEQGDRKGTTAEVILEERAVEAIPFWQAWDRGKKRLPLEKAQGCLAGEFINLYPPGTPIVVPGEVLSVGVMEKIKTCLAVGLEVQGIRDGMITTLEEEHL